MTMSGQFTEPLLRALRDHPTVDVPVVMRAADVAARWHAGQFRRTGDPYITHPVTVAMITADLGAGTDVVCAALLHDLVPDTDYTYDQMRHDFGDAITGLVERVEVLNRQGSGPTDRDAVLVKVADRLHNMRTLSCLRPEVQVRKAHQTMDVVVPVARQLGLDGIGLELAQLSMRYLRPPSPADRWSRGSLRVLELATLLLPAASRARWREEWRAEVSCLSGRGARVRFSLQTLVGVPRLAVTLNRRSGTPMWTSSLARIAKALGLGGAFIAFTAPGAVAVWVCCLVALAALGLLAATLFARTESPARRLAELIRAWRR